MEWGITVKVCENRCQPRGIATITPQWRAQLEVQGTAVETRFLCQRVSLLLERTRHTRSNSVCAAGLVIIWLLVVELRRERFPEPRGFGQAGVEQGQLHGSRL